MYVDRKVLEQGFGSPESMSFVSVLHGVRILSPVFSFSSYLIAGIFIICILAFRTVDRSPGSLGNLRIMGMILFLKVKLNKLELEQCYMNGLLKAG